MGTDGRKNTFIYQELPRKTSGEEFFIFFSPGKPEQEARLRSLFRDAISASRLGHPVNYFVHFIDRLEEVIDRGATADELLSGTLMMILIRRGEESYLFHNRDVELMHWNGEQGRAEPLESIPEISEVPLARGKEQQDLFRRSIADQFILRLFEITGGSHTVLLVPSREFADRHMETLKDSVFFPSFEIPADVGVAIETSRTFPAIHWSADDGKGGEPMVERSGQRFRRLSFPMAAGIITGLIAILIFFGPFRRKEPEPSLTDPTILLSATDDESAATPDDENRLDEAVSSYEKNEQIVTLNEAWKKSFDKPVTSSPVYHEGKVIFGCRDGFMYAFSSTGEPLWQYRSGDGIGASPACIADRVIGANYSGDVFCLNVDSGDKIWSCPAKAKIVSSPMVSENLLLVGTMEGRLIAIDLENGSKLWSQKLGAAIWANTSIGENYIIAATTDGSLVKLKRDGTILWRIKPGGGILSSPLCMNDENLVIFGTKDKYIYGYSISNGDLMWRQATGDEANGSPVTDGTTIFIGSEDGQLYALTTRGQLRWKRNLGGSILSRPLLIDGTIYVTSYASKLVAIDTDSGEVIGEYRTASPVYSSPTHDGRRIFFGSNTGVFYSLWLFGETG